MILVFSIVFFEFKFLGWRVVYLLRQQEWKGRGDRVINVEVGGDGGESSILFCFLVCKEGII